MNSIPASAPLRGLSLRSILPAATPVKSSDFLIRSCSGNWTECQPGDLFVAVVDADVDGHEFVQNAIERGASGIVTERLLAVECPQFIVDDSRQALGQICQALAGNPSDLLSMIGVAGSDGKTITSQLISEIVRVAGGRPATLNSLIENRQRLIPPPKSSGVPSCAGVASWLSNSVMDKTSHAVLEVDVQAIAAQQLHGMLFDILVLTNVRRDESSFGRLDSTHQQLLSRVLDFLKPMGMAVMNADDPKSQKLLDQIQIPALTFGINHAAEITGKVLERSANEQTFVITAGNESVVVNTPMIGIQHIYNCLAATSVGLILGIELTTIAKGLESADQIAGRLEPICCGQDFNLYIDAAFRATPVASAIHAVRQHTKGKLWVVASVGESQPTDELTRLGRILEKAADHVVLVPDESTSSIDYEPFHQVLDGFQHPSKVRMVLNRCRAIEWIIDNCPSGDSVLILGLGDRPFVSGAAGEWLVTDREICEAWIFHRSSFAHSIQGALQQIFNIDDYRAKKKKR